MAFFSFHDYKYYKITILMLLFASTIRHCNGFSRSRILLRTTGSRCRGVSSSSLWMQSNLISLEESIDLFNDGSRKVHFMDGSWYHKQGDRNGRSDFEQGPRIPGSHFFDWMELSTTHRTLTETGDEIVTPYMLPSPDMFETIMDAWGISNDDHVIVYGQSGAPFLPRIWFTFHTFGHEKVSLMQGSLQDWIKAGGPVDEKPVVVESFLADQATKAVKRYSAQDPTNVIALKEMKEMVLLISDSDTGSDSDSRGGDARKAETPIILDARGSSFAKGHMPGATQIAYSTLLDDTNGAFRNRHELRDIFVKTAGIDLMTTERPIICTCGSGVSACSLYLALKECGRHGNMWMYDGSWQEWKAYPDLPKVFGT